MIISKIQGGLGNQLFQWAIAKNLAYEINSVFSLDTSWYDSNQQRELQLPDYNIKLEKRNYYGPIRIIHDNFIFQNILDENTKYHLESGSLCLFLNGYWQSEKYFFKNRSMIKSCLKDPKIIKKLKADYPFLEKENVVSLHVRRGDYLTSNGYHPVQSIDYYNNALDLLGEHNRILVFSDDIDWCKENFKFKCDFVEDKNLKDAEIILLMSLCNKHIIANSSFSWWGAWLKKDENENIVAPQKWFGEHVELLTNDIVPQEWRKI